MTMMAKKKLGRKRVKRKFDMDKVPRKVSMPAREVVKEVEAAEEVEVRKGREERIWVIEGGVMIGMVVMTSGVVGRRLI